MIEISDVTKSILASSNVKYYVRAESWLGDVLLAESVPISSGAEEVNRSVNVPERITLTVPRLMDGFDWSPKTDDHPLAANGQRLKIELGIGNGFGQIEWFQRGWFLIQDAKTDGDVVEVEAWGLLAWILEARFISPFQPVGTFKSTVQDLLEPALTVVFDTSVVDRAIPASTLDLNEERLDALKTVMTSWGVDGWVTNEGYFFVIDEDSINLTTPVMDLTNGEGGTVIRSSGVSTREGVYNAVVVKGTTDDGGEVRGYAFDNFTGKRVGGDFNALAVPYYSDLPLVRTTAQARKAATTLLKKILRRTTKSYEIEIPPHPALQAGDVVRLTTDEVTNQLCVIEELSLPYTHRQGSMKLTVRSLT